MPHEGRGDMEQPVAERLGLGLLELAVEADHLRPGDKRPGDEAGGHPGEALGEASERQVLPCNPQSFQQRTRSSTRA